MIKAFAPGNISCVFVICKNKNPKKMGSLGVGITVNKGVVVSVRKAKKTKIQVNGKNIYFPTVLDVIKNLARGQVNILIKPQLPFGCGFGMSGASALATAYALNQLFNLKKSKKELAMVAHVAEVKNKTGLGDIAGQYKGGVCIKDKKGNPIDAERLDIKDNFVYYKVFSPLNTKKIIGNSRIEKKINSAGLKALGKIKTIKNQKRLTLGKIIKISKDFSIESGLLVNRKVKKAIAEIEKKKNFASMIMLGNAVYSNRLFPGSKRLKITRKGAFLVNGP